MVVDELTDGTRIGKLLSSEIHGHERGMLGRLAVVDADQDATPSESGTFGFAIARDGETGAGRADGDDRLAEVYLQPERVRVEVLVSANRAADAVADGDFEIRKEATDPPRSSILVESGAEVKAALRVVERLAEQVSDDGG
jgi:hypothetical protein